MRASPFLPFSLRTVLFLALGCGLAFAEDAKPQGPPAIPAAIPDTTDGKVIFQAVCIACHGQKGEGNEAIKSPAIAALPGWYLKTQMANFREGRRGTNPQDVPGLLMAAIAKMLKPAQVEGLAKHIETMELVIPSFAANPAGIDMQNGMLLFQERCMECHRYNASGELAFGSPPLIGRQDWYLKEQIEKFKNGMRGTIKGDENGAKMVRSSQFIEDEQSLKDVVAYIMTLNTDPVMRGVSDPFSTGPAPKTADASTDAAKPGDGK